MTDQLEKTLQAELDKDLGATRLRVALPKATMPDLPSVAQQLLNVAETIRGIHNDLDELQKEFERRLDDIRKRMGSKA